MTETQDGIKHERPVSMATRAVINLETTVPSAIIRQEHTDGDQTLFQQIVMECCIGSVFHSQIHIQF